MIDHNPRRQGEQGQTIVLVALTVVTMLAMAALAIDVVTLYVARTEMQRAADGAALAAAKAFVDSGVTTDPTNSARQTLATDMATALINTTMQQNKIGGVQPALVGTPTPDFTRNGNPQITVTLQRTDLPMFFARIWGSRAMTVTASATAEAYNPSSSQTSTGNYVPVQPQCVKPLLIPNIDPASKNPFVDPNTGAVNSTGAIGETMTLNPACTKNGAQGCSTITTPSNINPNPPKEGNFLAEDVTPPRTLSCPACQGASDYEQSIECCDQSPVTCGGTVATATVDITSRRGQIRNQTQNGIACMINKPSNDSLDPTDLLAGTGPARITANSGPQSGNLVTTSQSIAYFPIIDTTNPIGAKARVIGFLQGFVNDTSGPGSFTMTILNVVGCGNNPSGVAVLGGPHPNNSTQNGGTSPIPVRLIH